MGTVDGLALADGIAAQTTQTLRNIGRILHAGGASWHDVAKVNVYLHDMDDFLAMNEAYGAFFDAEQPGIPPATCSASSITSGSTVASFRAATS